ncbi:MAG: hypothetical protein ACTSR3_16795 [Candidatus Helarchaeota archaeon]
MKRQILKLKNNKPLLIASFMLLIYSIIECLDSVCLLLIVMGLIPNFYAESGMLGPKFTFAILFHPALFLPFFWSFTLMRITSTIGMFKNKLWGFWSAISSSIITIFCTMWLLPFDSYELLICTIILILLIIGYFGDAPIIAEEKPPK